MLVLARRVGESVVITTPSGEVVNLVVCSMDGSKVRLGFEAPLSTKIHRSEVIARIAKEGQRDAV